MNDIKERRYYHKIYFAWNYDKEEKMLNKKSEQGWNLIKGGCFHSVYEKDPMKNFSYRIDFNLNIRNSKIEYNRYIELNKELGWELINVTFNGWIFLRKEKGLGQLQEDEIYTDTDSFNAMLNRWIHFGYGILFVLFLISAVMAAMYAALKTPIYLYYSIIYFVCVIFIFYGIVRMKGKKK